MLAIVGLFLYLADPVLVPASSDITVDLPTPCFPSTPATRKSDWSIRCCRETNPQTLKSHDCHVTKYLRDPVLPAQTLVN